MTDSAACRPSQAEEQACLGLIADALFGEPVTGRPALADFLATPTMQTAPLNDLGVDSLEWMGLLTRLEARLGVELDDAVIADGPVSAREIARHAATRMAGAMSAGPEPSHVGRRFQVIDDFLPAPLFAALIRQVEGFEFSAVDSVVDAEVDGAAQRARGTVLKHDAPSGAGPVGEALSAVLAAIRATPQLYGEAGRDWSVLSAAFWKYPVGARLGWHNDAGKGRVGEFILYLHGAWRPSWGGELMILDEDPDALFAVDPESNLFKRVEAAVARSDAPLQAIQPWPNRLIMVEQGTPHAINRVDHAAGTACRLSLTGFAALRERSQPPRAERVAELERLMGWETPANGPVA